MVGIVPFLSYLYKSEVERAEPPFSLADPSPSLADLFVSRSVLYRSVRLSICHTICMCGLLRT